MSAASEDSQNRDASLIATPAAAAAAVGAPIDQGSKPIANDSKDSKDSRHDRPGQAGTVTDNGKEFRLNITRAVAEAAVAQKAKLPPPMSAIDEDVFYSAPAPAEEQPEAEDEEEPETSYQEPAPDQLLPPPDFKPFFTLIEDPESGEVHHPAVHYVFADDDQEILTDAALVAIDGPESSHAGIGADERFLLIDMSADGKAVLSATSLSPQWQNAKATVRQAPNFWQAGAEGKTGLMLSISGQETTSTKDLRQVASLDELVRTFGEKLDGLEEMLGPKEEGDAGDTTQADAHQQLVSS